MGIINSSIFKKGVKRAGLIVMFTGLIAGFTPLSVQAQSGDESLLKTLKKGDASFEKGNYAEALEYYQQANKQYSDDPLIERKVAFTLVKMDRYDEAFPLLFDLAGERDSADIKLRFYLARTYQHMGQYGKAADNYRTCRNNYDPEILKVSQNYLNAKIEQCEYNYELPFDTIHIRVERLPRSVNSFSADYHPKFMVKDSVLLFTSKRPDSFSFLEVFSGPDEDIYLSRWQHKEWSNARLVGISKNLEGNKAVVGVCNARDEVYLYSDANNGDLFKASFYGDQLRMESEFRELNTVDFTESSITIDEEGNRCFFVSNRTDLNSFGGMDIYIAQRNTDGSWGNIENAGPVVNSGADEDFVFWDNKDKMLYFSSNRQPSVGGFDIYRSRTDTEGGLKEAKNIGFPVNTVYDDISYWGENDLAWYSREMEGAGQDIFLVRYDFHQQKTDSWTRHSITGLKTIQNFEVVEDIYFGFEDYGLDLSDPALLHMAEVFKNTNDAKIRLTGYADYRGDEVSNNKISFNRASNLAQYLIDKGVSPKLLIVEARGEAKPVIDTDREYNSVEDILQVNRTVQITIEEQGSPFIYVDKRIKNKEGNGRFGIMCFISGEPAEVKCESCAMTESYSANDELYYYHSPWFSSVKEADEMLEKVRKEHPDAYLFVR